MGAWQLTRKDLRLLVRDRRALVLLIALPLIFMAILGFSSGRMMSWRDDDNPNGPRRLDIVDLDHGPMAREVIDKITSREGLTVTEVDDRSEADRRLDQGKSSVLLVIGPEFNERFEALGLGDILNPAQGKLKEGPSSLDMEVDYKRTFAHTGPIIRELLFSETLQTLVPHVARKNRIAARFVDRAGEPPLDEDGNPIEDESPTGAETAPAAGASKEPSSTPSAADKQDEPDDAGNLVYQQIVPSYTVLFVFFLINLMARSFITERDLGTLRRLRAAPLRTTDILFGKTLPFYLISLLQTVALFLFGRLLFGMSWGIEPWLLLPVIAVTSLAATSLGLLVATIVRTESQVSAYANFLVIVLGGISGCFLPRDWMPDIMQQVSLVTPHAWALIAYDQVLNHQPIDYAKVGQCCGMLAGFALVFFALGWWRFGTLD